jgi:hypothetical protein
MPMTSARAADLRFTCISRYRPEPLIPFEGGLWQGDEKAYALMKRLTAPYKITHTDIAYTGSGGQIRDTQADGEVRDRLKDYEIIDTSAVETIKAEHFLEWRGTSTSGSYKLIGRLMLDGSDHPTLYEWIWWPIPDDCSINDWQHGYCRSLPPTNDDRYTSDCTTSMPAAHSEEV